MALPKRNFSKSRRDKKRTHKKLSLPAMCTCSHCNEVKSPHKVCPHCGYYNGKQIIEIKKAS